MSFESLLRPKVMNKASVDFGIWSALALWFFAHGICFIFTAVVQYKPVL